MLVTNGSNVTYLTGFTGEESTLLVRPDGELLVSDFRFITQLAEECPDIDLHIRKSGVAMSAAVGKTVAAARIGKLGVESESISVALRDRLAEKLPKVEIVSTQGVVEKLRAVKDKGEIRQIREAITLAQRAFDVLRASLQPERTEKELAEQLEHQMRQFGAKDRAFPTIMAVGDRAALPHASPSAEKRIADADFVLVDWGANERLYHSDLTRVLVTGKLLPKLRRIYQVVLEAQTRAIEAIQPGVRTHDVDAVARKVIADAGFGRYFGHSLGHGIGLEVHEGPPLSTNNSTVLKAGMVVTVEPGIYLPGWGGVRIEDDVLVTRDGWEVLTSTPKELDQMVVGPLR